MIITCEECSTRFNLDDSLIKDDGSKVRCSVCMHTFTVFPPPTPLETQEEPLLALEDEEPFDAGPEEAPESDTQSKLDETPEFEMEDSDFSLDDSEFDFDDASDDMTDEGNVESEDMEIGLEDDFSFDDDQLSMEEDDDQELSLEMDDSPMDEDVELEFDDAEPEEFDGIEFETIDDDDPMLSQMPDEEAGIEIALEQDDENEQELEELSLEEDTAAEDDFELEFDVNDDNGDDLDSDIGAMDATELEIEPDQELDLEDAAETEEESAVIPEDDFDAYDDVLNQETEPEIDAPEFEEQEIDTDSEEPEVEEQADDEYVDAGVALMTESPEAKETTLAEEKPDTRPRRKKKPLIGTPVLIFILLFLLVVGAYIASLMTGYKIPYLSDVKVPFLEQVFKKEAKEAPLVKPAPNQKSVNGRFVNNTSAGTLFVITGTVDNPSQDTYSHIEVKGTLSVKGKVEAKTKTAYCGNIVSEDMLKTGNITDINNLLAVKQGLNSANVNIKPNSSVSFMIVFSNLPEKLQNFTVVVSGFEKSQAVK